MLSSHHFHPSVLREYDIRGIYPETLKEEDAWAIGYCFSKFLSSSPASVVVARDGRLSSPSLEDHLVQGLSAAGINIIRIGLGPTPLLYYAVHALKADGGIMITGSHNPADYNGFKISLNDRPFFGEDIRQFQHIAQNITLSHSAGTVMEKDIKQEYVDQLISAYNNRRPLKVVWDAGNGATGEILESLIEKLPGDHVLLYGQIDGTFPHHHPDPSDEHTLEDLKKAVIEHRADVGIAFDGDGDRLGVVDHLGYSLSPDHLLMLFSQDVLAHSPGASIILDVKTSDAVFDHITAHGGKPLMWKTGHSLIKKKMKETGSLFAGEMSGHLFFADQYYGFDDALYAAVRLLNIINSKPEPLSERVNLLPSYFSTPEFRIPCEEERKFKVIEEIQGRLTQERDVEVSTIDGVRVSTPKGWWLIRASNTQDVLVGRCESRNPHNLGDLLNIMKHNLKLSGISF
ncbi:MAG: phosphoglucomutase/phosphomannomutase PgmG [Alphaproteobacteria bacterium]